MLLDIHQQALHMLLVRMSGTQLSLQRYNFKSLMDIPADLPLQTRDVFTDLQGTPERFWFLTG